MSKNGRLILICGAQLKEQMEATYFMSEYLKVSLQKKLNSERNTFYVPIFMTIASYSFITAWKVKLKFRILKFFQLQAGRAAHVSFLPTILTLHTDGLLGLLHMQVWPHHHHNQTTGLFPRLTVPGPGVGHRLRRMDLGKCFSRLPVWK